MILEAGKLSKIFGICDGYEAQMSHKDTCRKAERWRLGAL